LGINGGHDSSVTFIDKNGQVRIFEYERFVKIRYANLPTNTPEESYVLDEENAIKFLNYVKSQLKEEIEIIAYSELQIYVIDILKKIFPKSDFYRMGHHMSHCSGACFQSGFEKSLVISIDGGGLDYEYQGELCLRSYSIYKFENKKFDTITHTNAEGPNKFIFDPGVYGVFGYYVSEIKNEVYPDGNSHKYGLSYAGKLMGLSAYGNVREEWIDPIENYYMNHPYAVWHDFDILAKKFSDEIGIELSENCLSGQDSYDLAATNQHVFENICFSFIKKYIDEYNLDVVFSGGCALNVLFNQKLKEYLDQRGLNLYIPPYPNDCGLSFGHFCSVQNEFHDPSPYCGIDIMDRDKLFDYYQQYNEQNKVQICTVERIVELIKDGKIGGIIQGYSEVGPRALGNRSIICDPSIKDMKDIINSKVKFREWFRPFAPVCREEDSYLYFENAYPSEYMSFAPKVKEEYKKLLPSITHEDGTARLQTVTKFQHSLFYDILTLLKERGEIAVIMNTSFNIRGNPILTTIEDAFIVLETTELDFIIVENLLFVKELK